MIQPGSVGMYYTSHAATSINILALLISALTILDLLQLSSIITSLINVQVTYLVTEFKVFTSVDTVGIYKHLVTLAQPYTLNLSGTPHKNRVCVYIYIREIPLEVDQAECDHRLLTVLQSIAVA